MDHRAYAKQLLVHYFRLIKPDLDPDCISEIESIVDSIIEAVEQGED